MKDIIVQEIIEQKIYLIRGQKVMLDRDLALLYEITTSNFSEADPAASCGASGQLLFLMCRLRRQTIYSPSSP